jgi:predicted MFS family arabinose efflux permease
VTRHLYTDGRARARALGIWAAISGTALALGPVVAGVLVGLSGWRLVFWFNLLLGAGALAAAWRLVPESADPEGATLDVPGVVLGAASLATLTTAVIEGERVGYDAWWIVGLFGGSVATGVAFVVVELRRRRPMFDLRLLRNAPFTASNLVAFTTYFGTFALFFFVALFLQLLASQSPYGIALDFLPMAVVMIAASALTGRWVARSGHRMPMALGCLVGGAGILLTDAMIGPDAGFAELWWPLAIAGAGFGVALVPATSVALEVVAPGRSGMAASATNTSRLLGAVFGVAVLGALVNAQLTGDLRARLDELGIPPSFQSVVMEAVTEGAVPEDAEAAAEMHPAAADAGPIVDQVIDAAQGAFASGLHLALVISAMLLLASGVVAWYALGWYPVGASRGASGRPRSALAWLRPAALVVAVAAAAWAVGSTTAPDSGSSNGVTSSAPTSVPGPGAAIPPATEPSERRGGATEAPGPVIAVSPQSGLRDGQTVDVTGHGFPPHASLVVIQCAAAETVSADDCAISHARSTSADETGAVSAQLDVERGPFGASGARCGSARPCQIVVSAPSPDAGAARATAPLLFAGG